MNNNDNRKLNIFNEQIWDNFKYAVNRRDGDVVYYVCTLYKRGLCRARAILKDNVFTLTKGHTHGPNLKQIMDNKFKRELYKEVTSTAGSFRTAYDKVRQKHPDASVRVTFSKVENNLYKWRRHLWPPSVQSLHLYTETLNNDNWKHLLNYKGGRMNVSFVVDEELSESVIFLDPAYCRKVCSNGVFFLDATFKVVPKSIGADQLLTIMSLTFGQAIPCIWVLMQRKTKKAYRAVFREIKRLIPDLQMREVLTDFETGLQTAVELEFQGVIVHGCLFHHNQMLLRNFIKFGLEHFLEESEEIRHTISLIMSLPLLPANKIQETYEDIVLSLTEETKGRLNRFFEYYTREWLTVIKPERFSVYMLLNRTNNFLESYNKTLKEKLGVHSDIWVFTKCIINFQENLHIDFSSLQQGHRISRLPKVETAMRKKMIIHAWSILNQPNGFTPLQFLEHILSIKINTFNAYRALFGDN